jgi:hypothetical protein
VTIEIQNVEADFFRHDDVFQSSGSTTWTWSTGTRDDNLRFLHHDVVNKQANGKVAVTGRSVSTDNNLKPTSRFTVTLSTTVGTGGLLTFVGVRVPSS